MCGNSCSNKAKKDDGKRCWSVEGRKRREQNKTLREVGGEVSFKWYKKAVSSVIPILFYHKGAGELMT